MRNKGLTAEQKVLREGKLTGSRVAALMNGDEQGILQLWKEMVGDPSAVEIDLSNHWAAQLGLATEALNLDWYEKRTGRPVTRRGEVVTHPKMDWIAATLDGWDDELKCVVEAKHVGGWEDLDTILQRYQPQFQWNMIATRSAHLVASIIEGTKEPVRENIPYDGTYAAEMIRRGLSFMECVWDMRPPLVLPAVDPPVVPTIEVDMKETPMANEWADKAATWLENRDAVKKAADAEKDLKSLMPADAVKAFGFGIFIKRDKAGRLSLRKEGEK